MLRGPNTRSRTPSMRGRPHPSGARRRLEPGEVEALSPRIGDVHQVSNAFSDRTSISIHVYGANIGAVRRAVFSAEGEENPSFPAIPTAACPISGTCRKRTPHEPDRRTHLPRYPRRSPRAGSWRCSTCARRTRSPRPIPCSPPTCRCPGWNWRSMPGCRAATRRLPSTTTAKAWRRSPRNASSTSATATWPCSMAACPVGATPAASCSGM